MNTQEPDNAEASRATTVTQYIQLSHKEYSTDTKHKKLCIASLPKRHKSVRVRCQMFSLFYQFN